MINMPPIITVNQDDIDTFYKKVDMHLSDKGLISWAVLIDYAHPVEYYYGKEFARKCIEERYENSGRLLNNRYPMWRKKN